MYEIGLGYVRIRSIMPCVVRKPPACFNPPASSNSAP